MKVTDHTVIEKIFGEVPCSKWHWVMLGNAGGPVMMKNDDCPHADRECYPPDACPEYTKRMHLAWAVVERMKKDPKLSTPFGHWFNHESLWFNTAEDAAFKICEKALELTEEHNETSSRP